MSPILTFSVLELQRGYLYQNGIEFRQKVIGAGLNLFWGHLNYFSGGTDLSLTVGHVSECPHSGTRYSLVTGNSTKPNQTKTNKQTKPNITTPHNTVQKYAHFKVNHYYPGQGWGWGWY